MNSASFLLFDLVQEGVIDELPPGPMFDVHAFTFDRVHPELITTSAFPLFKIPIELFGHVTRYLSRDDLRSLALVDRDCCRLASLSLFKAVNIDVGANGGHELMHHLLTSPSPSSLYRCIRRLVVEALQEDPLGRPSPFTSLDVAPSGPSDVKHPAAAFQSTFRLLNSPLSNLHVLEWIGPAVPLVTLLRSLSSSSVRHLRLHSPLAEVDVDFGPLPRPLALETLDMHISPCTQYQHDLLAGLYRNFLGCIAPTLRQLVWKANCFAGDAIVDPDIVFPQLRSLSLFLEAPPSMPCVFGALLGRSTKVNSLLVDSEPAARRFLKSCVPVDSLEHFCWTQSRDTDLSLDDVLQFLHLNPQLETIHIPDPLSPTTIDESLMPLLRDHYDALTSLHLVWDAPTVSEQSLAHIASLPTLRSLWLSAGNQGVRSTWEVNHDLVRKHLSTLHSLETLAFSHDTYPTSAHPLAPRFCDYYATKALPVDLDISQYLTSEEYGVYQGRNAECKSLDYDDAISRQIQMRRRAWERWHAKRMGELAAKYSQVFPMLRWCFVGQLAFGRSTFENAFSTILDPPQREPHLFSLHRKLCLGTWRPI
ncbi:hypothetical protein CVT26_013478 [Gymnopilus dilepis]|uniref:F-box domain-containing protein n=1 Tax=Gymnopilus dilepis TaxID=231916 RepID=A0A409YWN9_9AGAR|nr:hypothetical protein CVT26_013478 [Gymnopilus dilepis]